MRILIADDDPDIRRLLQVSLEAAKYEVIVGQNGQEALDLFKQHNPDIVLLDVMMPVMDGLTCLDRIRDLPNGAEVPVAFLTAQDTYAEAVKHGPNDFLTKPVARAELLARVGNLFRMKSLADKFRETEKNKERVLHDVQTHLGKPVTDILAHAHSLRVSFNDPRLDDIIKAADKLKDLVEHLQARAGS